MIEPWRQERKSEVARRIDWLFPGDGSVASVVQHFGVIDWTARPRIDHPPRNQSLRGLRQSGLRKQ